MSTSTDTSMIDEVARARAARELIRLNARGEKIGVHQFFRPAYPGSFTAGRVVFTGGPAGDHSIDAELSSPERVNAHFAGYIENAERAR